MSGSNRGYEAVIEPDGQPSADRTDLDLEFQDFPTQETPSAAPQSKYHPDISGKLGILQHYFDVETEQVLHRCLASVYPRENFLDVLEESPDAYGPFWICSTVVLVLFFASTIAGYIASHLTSAEYHYDFTKLTAAATLMYGYYTLLPLGLWAVLRWFKCEPKLMECVCLYGYSATIWVPVALVSIAPFEIFRFVVMSNLIRWIAVIIGFAISTIFLFRNLWPVMSRADAKTSRFMLIGVVALQAGLALALKLLFFRYKTEVI